MNPFDGLTTPHKPTWMFDICEMIWRVVGKVLRTCRGSFSTRPARINALPSVADVLEMTLTSDRTVSGTAAPRRSATLHWQKISTRHAISTLVTRTIVISTSGRGTSQRKTSSAVDFAPGAELDTNGPARQGAKLAQNPR